MTASVPYDIDSGDMDINDYMDELFRARTPEKRGWCRPGFTMNPVLNRCVPTMRSVHNYSRSKNIPHGLDCVLQKKTNKIFLVFCKTQPRWYIIFDIFIWMKYTLGFKTILNPQYKPIKYVQLKNEYR